MAMPAVFVVVLFSQLSIEASATARAVSVSGALEWTAQTRRECPTCLNGGLCLPEGGPANEAVPALLPANEAPKWRCFCKPTFAGATCADRVDEVAAAPQATGLDVGTEDVLKVRGEEDDLQQQLLDAEAAQAAPAPQVQLASAAPAAEAVTLAPEGPLITVNLRLGSGVRSLDANSLALSVYVALCPATPCELGIMLEDVRVDARGPRPLVEVGAEARDAEAVRKALDRMHADPSGPLRSGASGLWLPRARAWLPSSAGATAAAPEMTKYLSSRPAARAVSMHGARSSSRRQEPEGGGGEDDGGEVDWEDESAMASEWISESLGRNRDSLSYSMLCIAALITHFGFIIVAQVVTERGQRLSGNKMDGTSDFYRIWWMLMRAKLSASFTPMLCVIILLVHLRAQQLTHGFGSPPAWARELMTISTASMLANTVLLLAISGLVGPHSVKEGVSPRAAPQGGGIPGIPGTAQRELAPRGGQDEDAEFVNLEGQDELEFEAKELSPLIRVVKTILDLFYIITCGTLYFCAFGLFEAMITMTPEGCLGSAEEAEGLWEGQSPPGLSDEHRVCVHLAFQSLLVYSLQLLCVSVAEVFQSNGFGVPGFIKICNNAMRFAKMTVRLLPMLCLLFIAAHAHHAEVQPADTWQTTARVFFCDAMTAVCPLYTLVTVVFAILPKEFGIRPSYPSGITAHSFLVDHFSPKSENPGVEYLFTMVRWVALIFIYICYGVVCLSIFGIESPPESGPSPPIRMSHFWVSCLAMQYLFFYNVLLLHDTLLSYVRAEDGTAKQLLLSAIREIDDFVSLCPTTAALFIVTGERAEAVTRTGKPQGWALTAMNIVVQTLMFQQLMVLIEVMVARPLLVQEENQVKKAISIRKSRSSLSTRRSYDTNRGREPLVDVEMDPWLRGDPVRPLDPNDPMNGGASSSSSAWAGAQEPEIAVNEEEAGFAEAKFLAQRCLTILMSVVQFVLMAVLVLSTLVVLIALWSLNEDTPSGGTLIVRDHDPHNNVWPRAHMSTGMGCVMYLVVVFFACKVPVFFYRMTTYIYNSFAETMMTILMDQISEMVEIAPMLGVLFLVVRTRARELHGLNATAPHFTQDHMVFTTASIVVLVALTLTDTILFGRSTQNEEKAPMHAAMRWIMFVLRVLALTMMYVGSASIVMDIVYMKPEQVVLADGHTGVGWQGDGEPPGLRSTLMCVWAVISLFLALNGLVQVTIWWLQRLERAEGSNFGSRMEWWQGKIHSLPVRIYYAGILARESVASAPGLGLVFIMIEQHRQLHGIDQSADDALATAFTVATVAMYLEVLFMFTIGFTEDPPSGRMPTVTDVVDLAESAQLVSAKLTFDEHLKRMNGLRGLALAAAVAGTGSVAYVVYELYHIGAGGQLEGHDILTHNASLALVAFFTVTYGVWRIFVLCSQYLMIYEILLDLLSICPMLTVLFITIRQRAFEIVGPEGVVPVWVVHQMNLCVVFLGMEIATMFMLPLVAKDPPKVEEDPHQDGSEMVDPASFGASPRMGKADTESGKAARDLVVTMRALIFFALYTCTGLVIFSAFTLTEESCTPVRS